MSARGHHGVRNPKKARKDPYGKKKRGKRGGRPWDEDFLNDDYSRGDRRNGK